MSDAATDPAPTDEPAAADDTTPVVDDSVGTDAVDPTVASTDEAPAESTDGPATGDAPEPSATPSTSDSGSTDTAAAAELPDSVAPSSEPVVTAASAAGTVALPDVTGGGLPDPSSTVSSTPSDDGTESGDLQPSESSGTSSTPIYDELIASSGEGEVLHSEVAPNLSDPTPTNSYANRHHRIFKHGLAWYLAEVGWIGPEATTVLEEDLVPLRDLLNTLILDLGL